jgi:hypothetical protein
MKLFILFLFALAGAAQAADKDPLRALHADCAKASDVWSCLQLEAWAKAHDQKLRPLLGDSVVHGDILFAFPQPITNHWENQDFIGVATSNRFYLLAPDGRPLAKSIPLPPAVNGTALSFNGQYLATIQVIGVMDETELTVSARHVGGTVSGDFRIRQGTWWNGMAVANDGSAVVMGLRTQMQDQPDDFRLILFAGGKRKQFDHMLNVAGVGPNGSWLIAEQMQPQRHWVLMLGDTEIPIRDSAVGPGTAVVIADDKALWITAAGKTEEFPLPFGLGNPPQLMTLGSWFVFGSGDNGKSRETVDVLGNPIENARPQPYTTALYRWSDLAANPLAEPVEKIENAVCTVQTETAALFDWQDTQIDIVDLGTQEIARRPYAKLAAPVQWMDGKFHRTRVHCQDGTWVVLDDQGRELWQGKSNALEIVERRHAFITTGEKENAKYQITELDVDPAKRNKVDLELEPGAWWIEMDAWNLQTIAGQQNLWAGIDIESGKVISMNAMMEAKPKLRGMWDPPGRYRRQQTRLIAKSRFDDTPLLQRWQPIDAWRLNRTLVVLNERGSVYISGKKPGEFLDLGRCKGGRDLALGTDQPLVIVDNNDNVCGSIQPGPTLAEPRADEGRPKDLPPGPWRVSNMQFSSPRGKTLDWDTARVGFAPRRLRSPDGGNLLAITGSVVIELDPQGAAMVGKP